MSADPKASSAACARPSLPDGLPTPRRYWAAATVLTGISLSVLDTTIANVALPTIATDLHALPSQAVWIVNAYNLAVVALLLPLSALAERIGFKRMFSFGLALFALASLFGAVSQTLWQLTLARVVQGIGAATLMCMFGGLVRNIYPLRLLGRGISLNATTVAVMSVVGPTLGSVILEIAHWRWIFAINLPVCAAVMLGLRHLPVVPRTNVRLDWLSALLCMATLAVFISGVDTLGQNLVRGAVMIVAAILVGWVLVRRANNQPAPLVPVDLLRIRSVGFAVAASACTFAAQMASYVSLPFYFQQVLGRSYLEVGMLMGAWPVGTAIVAPLAGRMSDRYSAATLSGAGAGAMVIGLATLAFLPLDATNTWIMVAMFITGTGFGFFQTPNNRAMLSSSPRQRSGAAGGLQATTRVFGQSFGTALVAIAFGISGAAGPASALILAMLCAAVAVAVNVVRVNKLRPS
ncbi:MFS transporter [Bordetella petrii]|uniref:Transport protein n=1 Tax=Bordetella petrii (strain ATCC BAA-461 / DSM 12804 / CCUG 43448 / CIP 107267 / Se-1111R) TaxID=340100 RepID=A9HWM3_BORPD|nr:MFS transporter [Bordetella petrii]CAP40513.1 putative transport protein [Bordetella petrii]